MSDRRPLEPATAAGLRRSVDQAQRDWRAPSVSAVVTRARGQVFEHSRPDPVGDVQYRIGSVTKTFTAVLIMALRDAGKLNLEDS